MSTRHQRRKRAKAKAEACKRSEIIARNLSEPRSFERSDRLVSPVYDGTRLDRARGIGVVPMTRPTSGYRVIARSGRWTDRFK